MKKPIEDSIYLLDRLTDIHLKSAKDIRNLVKNWTTDSKDLGEEIAHVQEDVALCLKMIKKILKKHQLSISKNQQSSTTKRSKAAHKK